MLFPQRSSTHFPLASMYPPLSKVTNGFHVTVYVTFFSPAGSPQRSGSPPLRLPPQSLSQQAHLLKRSDGLAVSELQLWIS